MNAQPKADAFTRYSALGYAIVPVAPPDAQPHPDHVLSITKNRGKLPAVKTPLGWRPVSFRIESSPERLAEWRDSGASIGIRCEDGLLAIDADTPDIAHARIVNEEITKLIGPTPLRLGAKPKAIYVVRTEPGLALPTLSFDGGQVEFRTSGQFVAHGIHPRTGEPYDWRTALPPRSELPIVTARTLGALADALAARLPAAKKIAPSLRGSAPVDQEMLRGSQDRLERALDALPNGPEFDAYARYIMVCYAAKAAGGGEDWAREAFLKWCAKREQDLDLCAKHYDEINAPFRIGIDWIEEVAYAVTKGAFDPRPARWFETEYESIFGPDPSAQSTQTTFEIIDVGDFIGVEPPPQRWIVRDLIPERQVTSLSGDGGTGKSLAVMQLCVAMASETLWFDETTTPGTVLYVTAEEDRDELHRRLFRVCAAENIGVDRVRERLKLVSLWGRDAVLAAAETANGLLKRTALFGKLEKTIDLVQPLLVILDTRADMFGGDEIKRIHARQFIGLLQEIVRTRQTTILLLDHPSEAGMASGTGKSGNTAWSNSVRARLYLKRRVGSDKKEADPDVRILTVEKSNRSRVGREILLRYQNGRFVAQANARAFLTTDAESADEKIFMRLLALYEKNDEPVSMSNRSPRNYAPKVFAAHVKSEEIGVVRLTEAMNRLLEREEIRNEEYGPPTNRKKRLRTQVVENDLELAFPGADHMLTTC